LDSPRINLGKYQYFWIVDCSSLLFIGEYGAIFSIELKSGRFIFGTMKSFGKKMLNEVLVKAR